VSIPLLDSVHKERKVPFGMPTSFISLPLLFVQAFSHGLEERARRAGFLKKVTAGPPVSSATGRNTLARSCQDHFQHSISGRGAACHADPLQNTARPSAPSRDGTPTERSAAT
jgi:hypothetical protein